MQGIEGSAAAENVPRGPWDGPAAEGEVAECYTGAVAGDWEGLGSGLRLRDCGYLKAENGAGGRMMAAAERAEEAAAQVHLA